MDGKELRAQFERPGSAYRGKPFWSWNGELEKGELLRQMDVMEQMGFGGFFMHSRSGLITEYMGDEWFDCINALADAGAKRGLEAWLYDEDRWPSGSCGGKVTEDARLRMKSLYLYERDPAPWLAGERGMDGDADWYAARIGADGVSMSDYRAVQNGDAAAAFAALTGEGTDRLLEMRVVPDAPSSDYNGNTYIDTMSIEAVDRFIELTHEEYARRCGDRLGASIRGIFTDEPHRGHALDNTRTEPDGTRSCAVFYTDDIFDEFRRRYGYDARPRMPEVFYRLHGRPISRLRVDYFDLGCNLFNERFIGRIDDWCTRHNIILTGHVLHENSLSNQAIPNGSLARTYENMAWPGVDFLCEDERCYWIAVQCRSVCRQQGKKWMLSELYGCTGWRSDLRMYKVIGDWQALLGVNVRCPHLSWYTMEGQSKRDYPASISYQSPYWRDFAELETYFARFGLMMSQGEPLCDTLVLSPIESAWGLAHIGWSEWIFATAADERALEQRYADVFNELAGAHLDFDYADEQTLKRMASVERGDGVFLRVGQARYRQVLLTGMLTVRSSTLRILREFLAAGGRVALAGELPGYVDGEPSDGCRALEADGAEMLPETGFAGALTQGENCPVHCTAGSQVLMQVRRTDDGYIAALLNNDREHPTEVFRVEGPEGCQAQEWDMRTGARYAAGAEFMLEPAGTLLLVFTREEENLPRREEPAQTKTVRALADGEYGYHLDEPNVCLLDQASWSFDGGSVENGEGQPNGCFSGDAEDGEGQHDSCFGGGTEQAAAARCEGRFDVSAENEERRSARSGGGAEQPDGRFGDGAEQPDAHFSAGTAQPAAACRKDQPDHPNDRFAVEHPAEEVLRVDGRVRDLLGVERRGGAMLQPWFAKSACAQPYGTLRLRYRFRCETLPEGPVFLAGERPREQRCSLNGVALHAPDLNDWWADNAFVKTPVPEGALRLGENVVEIEVEFKRTTNVEALYLLGNFGVRAGADCVNTVTSLPGTLPLNGTAEKGLPFYTGRITYEIPASRYADCVDESARRVKLRVPRAVGALTAVDDGKRTQRLFCEPFEADVTGAVRAGRTLKLTLVNTRRNVFGPMHVLPAECRVCGPEHFVTDGDQWSDSYTFVPAGLGEVEFVSEK